MTVKGPPQTEERERLVPGGQEMQEPQAETRLLHQCEEKVVSVSLQLIFEFD